jgi:hypothetical protein
MLDIDHPRTPHIFHASCLLGRVCETGQRMSTAPASDRPALLAECLLVFAELRQLSKDHFEDAEFIRLGLDACEAGMHLLAALGKPLLPSQRPGIERPCPHCGCETETRALAGREGELTLCPYCVQLYMPALECLELLDGFGTEAI